jgi:bifunctional enzyme CysN/CysC
MRGRMSVVVAGHVDHGKSTIVGRLLADTDSLAEGKLEEVHSFCGQNGKSFEYAFLVDALQEERAQGITIDTARVFFRSAARDYIVLDAPGHAEFLGNMVTGAARADAAVLVVDVREGVRESSRRHAAMLSLLDINQLVVVVNKMDALDYAEAAFDAVVVELGELLDRTGLRPAATVPVSGREGDNLVVRSSRMPWYSGPTLLEQLDAFFEEAPAIAGPLRLPVQDVYKFAAHGDERRIVAGTIESGTLHVGDELVFYPSAKRGRIATIERFGGSPAVRAEAGQATGFTLVEPTYVRRGEVATRADEAPPVVASRFEVSVFWLGRFPLSPGREYVLKIGTARTLAKLESVDQVLDAATLASVNREEVGRHEVAECVLALRDRVACDLARNSARTGRFVLLDGYAIAGGGIVRRALAALTEEPPLVQSSITEDARRRRSGHRAALVIVTGGALEECLALAHGIEERVFAAGGQALAIGLEPGAARERVERLADTVRAMLAAGTLLLLAVPALSASELEALSRAAGDGPNRVLLVSCGGDLDLPADVIVLGPDGQADVVSQLARAGLFPASAG